MLSTLKARSSYEARTAINGENPLDSRTAQALVFEQHGKPSRTPIHFLVCRKSQVRANLSHFAKQSNDCICEASPDLTVGRGLK
ncbi:MAG: hypothetical protein ABL877_13675, partial [Thiobacillus sp.]